MVLQARPTTHGLLGAAACQMEAACWPTAYALRQGLQAAAHSLRSRANFTMVLHAITI